MQPIQDTTPELLFKEATDQIIAEKRSYASRMIKEKIQDMTRLAWDVSNIQRELKKKEKELEGVQGWLEKVKSGDWSVLPELDFEKTKQ